ncbi:SDR family oxidoreductase [Siculibacillus lacustris]|uniref:SDR family oxidoreductase n=1 Tax=Siculibacillus lacustris TaxID=1549641 RepID=A0A4Q9VI35_9HYPH|nr:SDR family oxidoreductase [Siculibacillus lacustris]TBW34858.1 SDR family oxidoreductase [Siculibacillus lacustris]
MDSSDSIAKIALVTGAGRGIGRATAIALAGAGYTVVLAGRRRAALDEVAATIAAAGGRARAVPTDVGDAAAVDALFAEIAATHGRLDLLFNNAGMGTGSVPIDELTVEQWNAVVAVNLTGAFLCTRAAFALMKRQSPRGGRIINNGSISAHVPRPNTVPYTMTKHAITGLTRSIALDGRAYDIVCGQIDIGNAATEMTEPMARGIVQPNGSMMVEPRMDVEIVARAVVHMASLPLEANILFMTVMASAMPFVGRG